MEQTHNSSIRTIKWLLVVVTLILLPSASFAYSSNICKKTGGCTQEEVGPFMQNISQACGNTGDCSLNDIMTVFVNLGNWVVGLIGSVVLLMYVVGGFYWLASAGRKEWVDKGKKYMTISTAGLLIVMFSYLGISVLRSVLQTGDIRGGNYVVCSGAETLEQACDLNSKCTQGGFVCESECRKNNPRATYTVGDDGGIIAATTSDCVDTSSYPRAGEGNPYIDGDCLTDQCPGGTSIQCCRIKYEY